MRVRVQVIVEPDGEDDEHPSVVHEVGQIERSELAVDTLGCSWLRPRSSCSRCRQC